MSFLSRTPRFPAPAKDGRRRSRDFQIEWKVVEQIAEQKYEYAKEHCKKQCRNEPAAKVRGIGHCKSSAVKQRSCLHFVPNRHNNSDLEWKYAAGLVVVPSRNPLVLSRDPRPCVSRLPEAAK
jgi:hypothetical protein